MTVLYGIDISSFQAGINLAQVRAEGFDFAFVKATQGSGYVNPAFARQLAAAQSAGLITAAYHYVTTDPVAEQITNITAHVPAGLPVILDVEKGSGDAVNARAIVVAVRAAGHSVPLLYLPQWYWQQIGSPNLSGLPPLWSSKYPSTNKASASALYQAVPQSYWAGYGNLPVSVLQFADSAQVAGMTVDASAFLGDRTQLAALIGGEENDLTPEQDQMLRDVHEQLMGNGSRSGGNPDGWPLLPATLQGAEYSGGPLTPIDFIREMHRELVQRLPNRVDGKSVDTMAGYSANSDAYGYKLLAAVTGLTGALAKEEADVLAAIKAVTTGAVDVQALATALDTVLPVGIAKALGQKLAA